MTSSESSGRPGRVVRWVQGWRASPWLSREALQEALRERFKSPVWDACTHLAEALAWLERAQDATPDDGFSRGYSLTWSPYFKARGWQPSYPETTGYIIPTFYELSRFLGRPALAERAERAARWEVEIQLDSGAVRGGVVGQATSPAVFNTGQVIFGWLSAFEETGDAAFADAARRAAHYLVGALDQDGHWRRGTSKFARADTTLYNARTAWALAEAGLRLNEPLFLENASVALAVVADRQRANGWIPDCCLSDPEHPLLHTLAYAVRGLLEGGRVLGDSRLVEAAVLSAEQLAASVDAKGRMPGRFAADWSRAAKWSCLTGQAQAANIWLRLFVMTGQPRWLEPVPRVLGFLKSTQNLSGSNNGTRGGIKGSAPVGGGYGTYQVLNWATKFFIDALVRFEGVRSGCAAPPADAFCLA